MKGFLFVGKEEDGLLDSLYTIGSIYDSAENYIVLSNGLLLKINKNSDTKSLEMTLAYFGHSETFDKQPGLSSFTFKQYRLSDGLFKTDSSGFLNSWRVTSIKSLLNPANHKSFTLNETYFKCDCPTHNEVLLNHETEITNSYMYGNTTFYSNNIYHFTGTLKCSRKEECTVTHSGTLTWTPLVLPNYIQVENVTVMIEGNKVACYFEPYIGKLHKVEWVAGEGAEVSLHVHDMLFTGPATYDILSNVFDSSGDACSLEKVRCVVTVYENDGFTASGPSLYSATLDLKENLGSANISFCVIDGHCYFENDPDPANTDNRCYPLINPYRWIRDLALDRVPGDICNHELSICENVPGRAYCSNVTYTCQCYPTFLSSPTSCDLIPCNTVSDCSQYTYSSHLVCNNSICACNITTALTHAGCIPKDIGSPCEEDIECSLKPHAVCGPTEPKTCVCGEHYNLLKGNCYPKGLGDTCDDDEVCQRIDHSACYDLHGTGFTCECDFGYSGNEFGLCKANGGNALLSC
ncbi:uncharacterized protein LOC127863824 [Dreissena polymorpha]|uniref:uncharacterized protein LOC127863824 n=1 Tax=Dreissena polymorpha TaxID=45954 RepID=UPI002264E51D|nr:uncharacterized protein LOC127863824 [Dreissena polymorpha]